MSNQHIKIEIARLPLAVVQGAFFKFHHNPSNNWTTKHEAVGWLATQVEAGVVGLNDISNAQPLPILPKGQPFVNPVPPLLVGGIDLNDKITTIEHSIIDNKNTINKTVSMIRDNDSVIINRFSRLEDTTSKLYGELVASRLDIYDKLSALKTEVTTAKPDTSAVQYEVAKAVRDAFEPFLEVVQNNNAQAAVAEVAHVLPIETKPVHEVFGVTVCDIKGNDLQVEVWNHPDAPEIDPDFIWTEDILRHLILAERNGENLWFGGEKGTGKSETARQFAARTGRAFKRINFHNHTSAEEYVGSIGLVDGQTVFQPKDFLLAYTSPSTVILLDEVTNADPGELAPLNGFLEPNACVSFGGQTHRRAKGVLVFAADNTFGNGDDTGRHVGTRTQNSALIDRFARVIPFSFLPEDQEIEALVKRTGCSREIADHVLYAIRVARTKVEQAEIVDAPSIRSAMAFIRSLSVLPVDVAWQTAVVARQPSESHAELNSIFTAFINADFIKSNI